jgi:hypothetical protein
MHRRVSIRFERHMRKAAGIDGKLCYRETASLRLVSSELHTASTESKSLALLSPYSQVVMQAASLVIPPVALCCHSYCCVQLSSRHPILTLVCTRSLSFQCPAAKYAHTSRQENTWIFANRCSHICTAVKGVCSNIERAVDICEASPNRQPSATSLTPDIFYRWYYPVPTTSRN